ncbi:MAG: CoB--CoM heterodisulfide reductase iron-sulfur subunit B family protein [Firmicutes bacterium]|nr:CoB--CoM heterodisulfide reductase iron-sulfur subunit B family protein [Bacillota bacterium]
MKVSYYPGCTLRTKAKELDRYARKCAEVLGVELYEIENWQCCGGVFVSAKDEIASKLPAVRALISAREQSQPLVTVCSACHNVIKQTNHAMSTDEDFAKKVNLYMTQDKNPPAEYHGETEVFHYLELLRDVIGFEKIKSAVVNPLSGRRIAAYYGCLLLRPGKVMGFDDAENPSIIEEFIKALGAEPVVYPMRNECCGGYVALEDAGSAARKSAAVFESAASHEADTIVTACPLCRYNLIKNGSRIPVAYFTELLAEALGVKEAVDAE